MNKLLKGCLIAFVLGLIVTAIGGYYVYQGAKEVYQEAAAEIEKTYKEEEAKLLSAPKSQILVSSLQDLVQKLEKAPAQSEDELSEQIVILSAYVATEENLAKNMPFKLPGDILLLQKDKAAYKENDQHAICLYANAYSEYFDKLQEHDEVKVRGRISFDEEGNFSLFPCLPEVAG